MSGRARAVHEVPLLFHSRFALMKVFRETIPSHLNIFSKQDNLLASCFGHKEKHIHDCHHYDGVLLLSQVKLRIIPIIDSQVVFRQHYFFCFPERPHVIHLYEHNVVRRTGIKDFLEFSYGHVFSKLY